MAMCRLSTKVTEELHYYGSGPYSNMMWPQWTAFFSKSILCATPFRTIESPTKFESLKGPLTSKVV